MVKISVRTSDDVFKKIEDLLNSLSLDIDIVYEDADIYFLEMNSIQDLQRLQFISQINQPFIYIIGIQSFEMIQECMRKHVSFYLIKERLEEELQKYKYEIIDHIQKNFQYSCYQKQGMMIKLKISNIYYVESMRHDLMIHYLNETFVERKKLSEFLETVPNYFVQIHKSYVVNMQWIRKKRGCEIILENNIVLPIGRSYKNQFMERKCDDEDKGS